MSASDAARAAEQPLETTRPIGIRTATARQREMNTRGRLRETAAASVRVEAIDESADDLVLGRATAVIETVIAAAVIAIVIVRAIGNAEARVSTATGAIDREGRNWQPPQRTGSARRVFISR